MVDLDRAFEDLDRLDAPVSWSQVANRQPSPLSAEPRRPRKVLVAVFAFAIAIAGMSLLLGAFPGRHKAPIASSSTPSEPAPSSALAVGGSGVVVAYSPTDVRFCDGSSMLDLSGLPPRCPPQIRVVGVDLSTLSNPTTKRGVAWGSAYLAGSFSNGVLHVIEQGPPRPPPDNRPRFVNPPCSPPSGGWATSPSGEPPTAVLDAYTRRFRTDVTSFAWFHPATLAWVGTIASTDPARTKAALAAAYPRQLCIVRSLYRMSEVHAAKAAATALLMQHLYGMSGVGSTVGNDGQPVVEVDATLDTPELHNALATQPAGLIVIVPWLAPVPSQATASTAIVSGHLFAVGGVSIALRPLNGTIRAVGSDEFTVSVGPDGAYSISVPAGRYTLTGRSPMYNGGAGACRATSSVTVTAGQIVSADVFCQEK